MARQRVAALSPVQDKHGFIGDSMYHELRCLLGAATVWQALKNQDAGFDVAIAMDSAFVHTRSLLNFFTRQSPHDVSITEFGPATPYVSALYATWFEPLHRHVLHINSGRENPKNIVGGVHLNEQVVACANEVLRLWGELEADAAASTYHTVLTDARMRAIADAKNDAGTRTTPIFQ